MRPSSVPQISSSTSCLRYSLNISHSILVCNPRLLSGLVQRGSNGGVAVCGQGRSPRRQMSAPTLEGASIPSLILALRLELRAGRELRVEGRAFPAWHPSVSRRTAQPLTTLTQCWLATRLFKTQFWAPRRSSRDPGVFPGTVSSPCLFLLLSCPPKVSLPARPRPLGRRPGEVAPGESQGIWSPLEQVLGQRSPKRAYCFIRNLKLGPQAVRPLPKAGDLLEVRPFRFRVCGKNPRTPLSTYVHLYAAQ